MSRLNSPGGHNQTNGFWRAEENGGDAPKHEPNSFGGPVQDPCYREFLTRYPATPAAVSNLAGHMQGIPERIAKLQIEHFTKAEPAYGCGVGEAPPGLRG